MKTLSHRGFWKRIMEKNTLQAFKKSYNSDFGLETDVRDSNGFLVISHDIPNENSILLEDFFKQYTKLGNNLTLALNIKSDGLCELLKLLLNKYSITNYFVFDMSIPDTIEYVKNKMNVFIRQSEYEKELPFYDDIAGVWMDCFDSDWITEKDINEHLRNNKKVCLVSPDLHGREKDKYWNIMKCWSCINSKNLYLCTDHPLEAQEVFCGKN